LKIKQLKKIKLKNIDITMKNPSEMVKNEDFDKRTIGKQWNQGSGVRSKE